MLLLCGAGNSQQVSSRLQIAAQQQRTCLLGERIRVDPQHKNDRMGRGREGWGRGERKAHISTEIVDEDFSPSWVALLIISPLLSRVLKSRHQRLPLPGNIVTSDEIVGFSKSVFSKMMEQKHIQKQQLQMITTWTEAYRCVFH